MGYTHYYDTPKEFNKELFAKVVTDFKKILPEILKVKIDKETIELAKINKEYDPDIHTKIVLGNGMGDKGSKMEITNDEILFNGLGELGHETFLLERKTQTEFTRHDGSKYTNEPRENGKYFNFCKTARKPYDLAVCAILIIAKQHLNDHIIIHSDGEINDEWVFPKKFVQKHLGYGKDFVLDTEDSS